MPRDDATLALIRAALGERRWGFQRVALAAGVGCVALLTVTGCAAGPRDVLAEIASAHHSIDTSDPSRKATPCGFTGSAAFIADESTATLKDEHGKVLGRSKLSESLVGVGGFCTTYAEFPDVPPLDRYELVIGRRSVELEGDEGEKLDGVDSGHGTPLSWQVFSDAFR